MVGHVLFARPDISIIAMAICSSLTSVMGSRRSDFSSCDSKRFNAPIRKSESIGMSESEQARMAVVSRLSKSCTPLPEWTVRS